MQKHAKTNISDKWKNCLIFTLVKNRYSNEKQISKNLC